MDTVVLHATVEPTLQGSIDILRDRGFSYHYLIDRDGEVTECVDPSLAAFHAGPSNGPQGEGVNEYSIGVSFVNENDGVTPYTDQQLQGARNLIRQLRVGQPELHWLTSHAAISPGRKDDPVGFPLQTFAASVGMQLWL